MPGYTGVGDIIMMTVLKRWGPYHFVDDFLMSEIGQHHLNLDKRFRLQHPSPTWMLPFDKKAHGVKLTKRGIF